MPSRSRRANRAGHRSEQHHLERTALLAATAARRAAVNQLIPLRAHAQGLAVHPAGRGV